MVHAHYNHAGVLTDLGRLEEAVAAFDIVLTLAPAHDEARNRRELLLERIKTGKAAKPN
jgi:predicted RNA polymerase sigma factor